MSLLFLLVTKPILLIKGITMSIKIKSKDSFFISQTPYDVVWCDWLNYRQVSIEEGENKAREFGALFMETSAKAGFNIKVNKQKHTHTSQCDTIFSLTWLLFCWVQPLFCKITSALQGNEAVSWTKQEDLVDVNLKPLMFSSQANHQQESNCSC